MRTPVLSAKLDALLATLDLVARSDVSGIVAGLQRGADRHALAIGSGGSAVAAEYLVRCRDTLGLGPTTVATPMRSVLDHHTLRGSNVWLFSAGGANPDACAAAQALMDRGAAEVNLVTRNPDGVAASIIARGGGHVHVVPVADVKDGYLATHSLLAMTAAMLLASNAASGTADASTTALDAVAGRLIASRESGNRARLAQAWSGHRATDTLIIAADPSLHPVASLLDTSLWEASICPVQSVDFRNLAHGRHAWLHHRPGETTVLALTGAETLDAWAAIEAVLPPIVRREAADYGVGGRLDNLLGLIDGLSLIEALGEAVGTDPGKPGIGDFGRAIYADRSLEGIAAELRPRLRQKRAAMAKADSPGCSYQNLSAVWKERLRGLTGEDVGGVVFDYDGTIVTTEGRFSPPVDAIVAQLVRLHRAGVRLGVATGRGGSAGEDLRKVLPPDVLSSLLIGYYNGGHIRAADIDIKEDPPRPDPAITATAGWLRGRDDLFLRKRFKEGPIQIGVDMVDLRHPYRFALDLAACPSVAGGEVRISASGHSFDIIPVTSCKTAVIEAVRRGAPPGTAVLCFGDSGSGSGNDHALLNHRHGISVGEVCGAPEGCWSLFGGAVTGPDALLRTLRALVASESGGIRLSDAELALDTL